MIKFILIIIIISYININNITINNDIILNSIKSDCNKLAYNITNNYDLFNF